jgi:hypothetical protein
MAKYFALHTYIKEPAATWEFFGKGAPALAAAMAAGQTPAKCLKTWNPAAFGRGDYIFCLWEAENPAQIEIVLRDSQMAEYIHTDLMPVAEIDWAELAQTVLHQAAA